MRTKQKKMIDFQISQPEHAPLIISDHTVEREVGEHQVPLSADLIGPKLE